MMQEVTADSTSSTEVRARIRAALNAAFGERIGRAVLYGSRARGDARADSDYDVALFLHDFAGRWPEARQLSSVATDLFYETGALVHALPFRSGAWLERSPLMGAIRRDGVDI